MQPKVSFFAWEATWVKVLTLDQVQKRGWALANRCYLCQAHEEFIDHLLLHCEKTREVWKLFFTLFGVHWVFPSSVRETLLGWKGAFVGKKRRAVWNGALYACFSLFGRQGTRLLLMMVCYPCKDESFFCIFALVEV